VASIPHGPADAQRRSRAGAAFLTAGALASFALALLHLGMAPVGKAAYEFFGAPERIVALANEGSVVPAIVTVVLSLVFAFFGACALAAARRTEQPALRILLVGITGIYLLRGLLIVPEAVVVTHAGYPPRLLVFSAVALAIGVVHAAGLALAFRRLSRP
jgi:hypothetical protein